MRKYLVFTISFTVLFAIIFYFIQILSGILLTAMYTPDTNKAWNNIYLLPQQSHISTSGNSLLLALLFVFIAASVSYFISKKFVRD